MLPMKKPEEAMNGGTYSVVNRHIEMSCMKFVVAGRLIRSLSWRRFVLWGMSGDVQPFDIIVLRD